MLKKFLLILIKIYQKFSSMTPKTCRFVPTCSEYAKEAIQKYGVLKGFFLAVKRILKCHPLNEGGFDPVP